jgi:hypothetical protein
MTIEKSHRFNQELTVSPYYIDTELQKIIILGIFNQNKWKE